MENMLRVENLSVKYPVKSSFFDMLAGKEKKYVHAVNGVDFTIGKGEILSLVGESGSGKTTAGKALLRLIDREQLKGKVIFDNKDVLNADREQLKHYRLKAQMIFQDPYQALNPRNTIYQIVSEPLIVNNITKYEKELHERVIDMLNEAGLKPAQDIINRYPHELSGGQRQRVAIAGTMVLNPSFVVADEPVSMLDVSIRADILKLMVELRERNNVSYLFITHDLSLAWVISDKIAIMYLGKILEIGNGDDIIKNPMNPYSKALIEAMPKIGIKRAKSDVKVFGEIPNPIDLPTGCVFHPRCPYAKSICREEEPILREIIKDHLVACHTI